MPLAQVQWIKKQEPVVNRGGVQEKSSGYLIFSVTELETMGYTPRRGDRITEIGRRQINLDLYLTENEPCGHYDGENWLLKFDFEDRLPSRRAG
jgi:hypothetical protein